MLFSFLSAVLALMVTGQEGKVEEVWPDGTKMDPWFGETVSIRDKDAQVYPDRTYDIRKFGAREGSDKVQTKKIQKAINKAARKGGTVVIPEGSFRSGALFFKPGTRLHLDKGAVLLGSQDIADYPWSDVHIEGVIQKYPAALINAYGVDGFAITGPGKIDGQGLPFWEAFWAHRKENPKCTNLEVLRPRMIYVCKSDNVSISGVRLENPGFWTTHLYKCSHVCVEGVKIRAPQKPVKAPSSDGIDLDACSDVHITGCDMSTGDDLVSIKGGKGPWADTDPDNGTNARILVENCKFGRGPGALVFGSECVGARNVILRNSTVSGTDRLLWLKMRPDTPQKYEYILVENIEGKADRMVYIKPWTQFFDLKGREDIPMSYASHVTVRGCHLSCRKAISITEQSDQYILKDFDIEDNYIRPDIPYNKDESKVPPYTLEDPLKMSDGTGVTAENWKERRAEILEIFQNGMYGRMPADSPVFTETVGPAKPAFDGEASVKTVRMWFREDRSGTHVDWMIVSPVAAQKSPAILMLNYYGNDAILADKGNGYSVFPLRKIISSGYSFVTACYEDISPDSEYPREQAEKAFTGIFDLWGPRDPSRGDSTGALCAWAWVLRRGLDMLEREPSIDATRVAITGSSRNGKAALIAAAFDERFPVAVINQAGGGGVTLSKRLLGESVTTETAIYTHWWCPNFSKYAGIETRMPFDQHLLVSCIAPRALLVEGFNNPWFDTLGEFKCLQAASPVWEMLGRQGLPNVDFPDNEQTTAIGQNLGYVRRDGKHGYYAQDWDWLLNFIEKAL